RARFQFSIFNFQFSNDVDHVAERADSAGAIVGNRDLEFFFDAEQDRQRVERIDPRLGQIRLRLQHVVGKVLLLPHDVNELARDLVPGHGAEEYTHAVKSRFALIYIVWIAVCATLFAVLSGAEAESRPRDRY